MNSLLLGSEVDALEDSNTDHLVEQEALDLVYHIGREYTLCPRSLDSFYIVIFFLYKISQDFIGTQNDTCSSQKMKTPKPYNPL